MNVTAKIFSKKYKYNRYWNYYYNKYEARYLDNNLFLNFLKNVKDSNASVKTNLDINLTPNLKLESSTLSDIKSSFGKPLYTFSRKIEKIRITVLLYKLKLLDFKVIAEFHFFENNLYYFVYNFVDAGESERKTIVDKVFNKYGAVYDNFELDNCYLIDPNENCLVFNDNVDFSLNYFNIKEKGAYHFFTSLLNKAESSNRRKYRFKEKMFYKLI